MHHDQFIALLRRAAGRTKFTLWALNTTDTTRTDGLILCIAATIARICPKMITICWKLLLQPYCPIMCVTPPKVFCRWKKEIGINRIPQRLQYQKWWSTVLALSDGTITILTGTFKHLFVAILMLESGNQANRCLPFQSTHFKAQSGLEKIYEIAWSGFLLEGDVAHIERHLGTILSRPARMGWDAR